MHIEFLIEDACGKNMLEVLLPKIYEGREDVTWTVHPYKGIGTMPQKGTCKVDPKVIRHRALLDNLPRLLAGYGHAWTAAHVQDQYAVVVVCDLDDHDQTAFMGELNKLLMKCREQPTTRFCFAIEEGEAWLLGDSSAVKMAYPKYKAIILSKYRQDSICGTWEKLADAVYPGGSMALAKRGYQAVGAEKCKWAEMITPHLNVTKNRSPSFQQFRQTIENLVS